MLLEADDSIDELTPWGEWDDDDDVAVQIAPDPAQARDGQIEKSLAIHEAIRVRLWSSIQGDAGPDDMLVIKLEMGKIKKRRYVKRGDGTRRHHGRPQDLTPGGSFGHIESWNMGVYPGRGPALISRADMIILPLATPSAIASEDSSTLSAGVSAHSAAGASVTGF